MKLLLGFFLTLLLVATALAQESHAGKIVDTLGDKLSKSTLAKVDDIFSDNATVYWVDKKLYGKAVLLKYLKEQLEASDKHVFSFSPDDELEDENISTCWGTFAILYGTGDSPISNQVLGRYSVIAKNDGGSWKIVSLHLSISRLGE